MKFDTLSTILIIFLLCFSFFVGTIYHLKSEACEDFGGKITGNLECYKEGNIYEVVEVGIFSFKFKVAKPMVGVD